MFGPDPRRLVLDVARAIAREAESLAESARDEKISRFEASIVRAEAIGLARALDLAADALKAAKLGAAMDALADKMSAKAESVVATIAQEGAKAVTDVQVKDA